MPSLKDLKNRIESVKATRKITKAMQMVAAAKLRRAQEAAEMARPYAERMEAVMAASPRPWASPKARRAFWRAPARTRCICWWSDRRARSVRRLQLAIVRLARAASTAEGRRARR
jgi:ATP synthase F1 gamma subunit